MHTVALFYIIKNKKIFMLTTIAIILLVLWLLGLLSGFALGGFIHVLLVVAIILFLIRVIRGENPLK
jgi:predicted membrane metal-binding protein